MTNRNLSRNKFIPGLFFTLLAAAAWVYAGQSVYYGITESSATGKATERISGALQIAASTATANTPTITLDGTDGIAANALTVTSSVTVSTVTARYGNLPILIASGTLASAASELDFDSLDSSRDGMYELCMSIKNSTDVYIYINSDTTDSNYRTQEIYANDVYAGAVRNSAPQLFFTAQGGIGGGCAKILLNAEGYPTIFVLPHNKGGTTGAILSTKTIMRISSTTAITEISLATPTPPYMGAGTRYSLTKTPF